MQDYTHLLLSPPLTSSQEDTSLAVAARPTEKSKSVKRLVRCAVGVHAMTGSREDTSGGIAVPADGCRQILNQSGWAIKKHYCVAGLPATVTNQHLWIADCKSSGSRN